MSTLDLHTHTHTQEENANTYTHAFANIVITIMPALRRGVLEARRFSCENELFLIRSPNQAWPYLASKVGQDHLYS